MTAAPANGVEAKADRRVGVLHLIDHYRIGGPGKTILNSYRYIDSSRFRIDVGFFVPGDAGRTEFSEAVEAAGIPHVRLSDRRWISLRDFRRLRGYILSRGIRILHTHGYKTDAIGLLIKAFSPDLRLVTTHHGWIQNNRFQRAKVGLGLFASRFFSGVVVVSEPLERLLPAAVRRSGRSRLIHNAIVKDDYVPTGDREKVRRELGVGPDDVLIGAVGRLSPEKGCRELLGAFAGKLRDVPGTRLVFVGEGPLRAALEEEARTLGVEARVVFAGYRNPVQPLYEAMDVFVCPSRTEGLSNAILEAMALSVAVLATDVGGNREIVEDGTNGLLVPAGQYGELAEKLRALTVDSSLRGRLVAAGLDTIDRRFRFDLRMRAIERFYDDLLGSARAE